MGLIARLLEANGIPTLSMTSALDITRAAWPPRAAFLDFPLGHTAGRPDSAKLNVDIMRDTLGAFETLTEPGSVAQLRFRWSHTDAWKDTEYLPERDTNGEPAYVDDRVERHTSPQYQTDDDAQAAAATHDGQDCLVCAGVDY